MLHILWMLIKFILILLGIILGLALFLILLILFCPVHYQAAAVKEGVPLLETEAELKVSWLFGGISFQFLHRNKKGNFDVRIFGLRVLKLLEKRKTKKTAGSSRKAQAFSQKPEETSESLVFPEISGEKQQTEGQIRQLENAVPEPGTPFQKKEDFRDSNLTKQKKNKITEILEKLKKVWNRLKDIPSVIHKMSLTIHNIYDKIDWWKQFMEHPRTKAGIAFVRTRAGKLFRHIFPRKIQGYITLGSEDPSITGMALAVLGMTMPLHRNRIQITPVFENRNLLEGNVILGGRIFGFVILKILLEIYFNKDIKYIISRWKHKEV